MGRYATFSTGLEYKFWFAVQESTDILELGGIRRNNRGYNLGMVAWNRKLDFDFIRGELETLTQETLTQETLTQETLTQETLTQETLTETIEERLQRQSLDKDGTQKLLWDTQKLQLDLPEIIQAKIHLGSIIAHQLLQEPDLSAEFEIM